jgi:spermidine synthase
MHHKCPVCPYITPTLADSRLTLFCTTQYYPGYAAACLFQTERFCHWLQRSEMPKTQQPAPPVPEVRELLILSVVVKQGRCQEDLNGKDYVMRIGAEPFEASKMYASARGGCVANHNLRTNELVGFICGKRVTLAPGEGLKLSVRAGTGEEQNAERWHPNGEDMFFARENLKEEEPEESSDDEQRSDTSDDDDDEHVFDTLCDSGKAVKSRGGVFFLPGDDNNSRSKLTTLGGTVCREVRTEPNTKRVPFRHPVLGACFALVATKDIHSNEIITQPPDYECGWALAPVSEAGYYHHLRVSPPTLIFEKPGSSGQGQVKVTQHGPWRVLWLDNVEQGLAYDAWLHKTVHKYRKNTGVMIRKFTHWPNALGFEYVRAMATTAIVAACVASDTERGVTKNAQNHLEIKEALCVGLGAGSLPAFLRNSKFFQKVTAVEIDTVVVEAATGFLGVSGEGLVVEDASVFVRKQKEFIHKFHVICLDAYDGAGHIPEHLTAKQFLHDVRSVLHTSGSIMANCFYGPPGSSAFDNLTAFCDTLGEELEDAPPVTIKLVRVAGQESNVVVVATAAESHDSRIADSTFVDSNTLSGAFLRCKQFVEDQVYDALCDGTKLDVFDPPTRRCAAAASEMEGR